MILAEQIAYYLASKELGNYSDCDTDGTIHIDKLPDGEKLIAIYNRSGRPSDSKLGYQTAGIQIIYRGDKNPIESMDIADEIFFVMQGFHNDYFLSTYGNVIVSCLSENGGAYGLGANKNSNYEYTMNFNIDFKKV